MYLPHLATARSPLAVLTISPVCLGQESIDSSQASDEQSELHDTLLFPEHEPIGSHLSRTLQSLALEEGVQPASCQQMLSSSGLDPKPEYPLVRLTGFFQADAGWFAQDAANIAAVGDIQDGADFRRARLAATGNVADNVAYMIEFDFAFPGRPTFMDVWLEIQNLSLLQKFRVGLFRVPFGLDGQTSAKELTFIERALPFAFLPFRQIGVMAHGTNRDEDFTWAYLAFVSQQICTVARSATTAATVWQHD